ncbi:hypothetical protein CHS0354_009078 [Potamilus streckersoni]|uniref:Sushi domain-containing protein n=1 Tax=Potamilus streckersoni TaxID=2493646 RepID=A0AAE0WDW6_9BIVA|nr:hypothetical protein CHS0354_009078 [Potamilus streckersoni]
MLSRGENFDSLCSAYVPNGWISSDCNRHESETCSINCNLGYTLTLPGMTTCLSSGRWDVDLSNVCVFENRDSISSDFEAPASSNIIIPLTLASVAVTTIIVGIIIVCFRSRCQSRGTRSRFPHNETSSNGHIPTMYSVGQCRIGCNLNLRSGAQTSFQARDASPPSYTEVMINNRADQDPPPSYEEVNARPSSFLPDSYI